MKHAQISAIIFFLFIPLSLATVQINEIMYNPAHCSDSKCEWVELFNPSNQSVNLTSCYFQEKQLLGIILPEEYLVLVRDANSFTKHFTSSSNILDHSFSLKNSGEELSLTGNCSDSIDYSLLTQFANGNNKTLEKTKEGKWEESLIEQGTPGKQNSVYEITQDFSNLKLSEIYPQPPEGADEVKPFGEWIELYNGGDFPINLQGLYLYDDHSGHKLKISHSNVIEGTIICAGCYKRVFRNGYYNFNLKDSGDSISLYSNAKEAAGTEIDSVSYTSSSKGLTWSNIGGDWFETAPTPDGQNTFKPGCDWQITLKTNNSLFQPNEVGFTVAVKKVQGLTQNITVRGVVEDVFGQKIKEYKPWTEKEIIFFEEKEYSPNLKEDIYHAKFSILNLSCEDIDLSNNEASILFATNPQYKQNESSISIEEIYLGSDNTAEWGDQIRVKVHIYKGDETKKSVQVWVEKNGEQVSHRTRVTIEDPFKHYPLTLPIQLEPNCDNKISNGNAKLVIEAFDKRAEKEFKIEDVDTTICKDYLNEIKKIAAASNRIVYEIVNFESIAQSGKYFPLTLQISNDDKSHDFNAWTYVYRGSKCYSCQDGSLERETDTNSFTLDKNEVKQIRFTPLLDELEPGEYKVKVKIRKDDQKSTHDLTEEITVIEVLKNQSKTEEISVTATPLSPESEISQIDSSSPSFSNYDSSGIVVYESNSTKAYGLIPTFLIVSLMLLLIAVMWKK